MNLRQLNEKMLPKNSSLNGMKLVIGGRNENFKIKLTSHAFDVRDDDKNIPEKERKTIDPEIQKAVDVATSKNKDVIKCKLDKSGESCKCKKNGVPIETTKEDWEIKNNKCSAKSKVVSNEDKGVSRIDLLSAGEITRSLKIGMKYFLKLNHGNINDLIGFARTARLNLHLNIDLGDIKEKDSSGSMRKVKKYSKIIFTVNKNRRTGEIEVVVITVYPVIRTEYQSTTSQRFTLDI